MGSQNRGVIILDKICFLVLNNSNLNFFLVFGYFPGGRYWPEYLPSRKIETVPWSLYPPPLFFLGCSKVKAEEVYCGVKESRQVYQPIAICAAVLFKVSSVMRRINHVYQISIHQFLCYFDNSLKYSERFVFLILLFYFHDHFVLCWVKDNEIIVEINL